VGGGSAADGRADGDAVSAEAAQAAQDRAAESRLAAHFVRLVESVAADVDVDDVMDRLVRSCVELLGGTSAGVLLADDAARPRLAASSDERVRMLELFQIQSQQGPSLACLATAQVQPSDPLGATAQRWPRFAAAAEVMGYHGVLSLPLQRRAGVVGTLDLLTPPGRHLSEAERHIARSLADVAAVGLAQGRSLQAAAVLASQLREALTSRVVIEQAKGVVAEHARLSMDDAFKALRTHARNRNLRLTAVAEDVVGRRLDVDALAQARRGRRS
jgi:signal transduction protein with GAF and PtsI domain